MPIPSAKSKPVTNYLHKSYLVYGLPKIGKTTLISNFGDDTSKVLFFPTEDGHKELSLYIWAKENGESPTCWADFLQCAKELTEQKEFRVLAIDTADNLFDWCKVHVIKQYNERARKAKKDQIFHESDADFGKVYSFIKDELKKVVNFLTQKGYAIIFISHSQQNEKKVNKKKIMFTDTTLPNTAKKVIHPMCYYILYLHIDENGNRIIRTKQNDETNAGDRSGKLSEIIPLEPDGKSLKAELMK